MVAAVSAQVRQCYNCGEQGHFASASAMAKAKEGHTEEREEELQDFWVGSKAGSRKAVCLKAKANHPKEDASSVVAITAL